MPEQVDQCSSNTAQKVAKAVTNQLTIQITKKTKGDKRKRREILGLLAPFEKVFIEILIQKKPVALLFSNSPDIILLGLAGINELTPYFSFKMSVVFDWSVGHALITHFSSTRKK